MRSELLRDSIDTLKSVRLELHGNAESSVLEMLDKAIYDLEKLQQNPDKISTQDVLKVLGRVLEKLPAVIGIIQILTNR